MKRLLFLVAFSAALTGAAFAQSETGSSSLLKPGSLRLSSSPSPKPTAAASPAAKESPEGKTETQTKGPTEITATEQATFDEKTRIAVFTGAVHVNDPQFVMDCDKLTAYLKKDVVKGAASPTPGAPEKKSGSQQGGLEKAIGEGHVVIVQDKPGAPGEQPTRYIGRSERCEYEAATGDMRLIGNPQVQQGVNTHVSMSPSTIMILNKDGRMRTEGPTRTLIQDQSTFGQEKTPRP